MAENIIKMSNNQFEPRKIFEHKEHVYCHFYEK